MQRGIHGKGRSWRVRKWVYLHLRPNHVPCSSWLQSPPTDYVVPWDLARVLGLRLQWPKEIPSIAKLLRASLRFTGRIAATIGINPKFFFLIFRWVNDKSARYIQCNTCLDLSQAARAILPSATLVMPRLVQPLPQPLPMRPVRPLQVIQQVGWRSESDGGCDVD